MRWLSEIKLVPLVAVPYVLTATVIFFRNRRFFAKPSDRVVGLFIFDEEPSVLHISSLAVAAELRRFGIASCTLDYAERIAKKLDKEYLELSVLKKNPAAQSLYQKFRLSLKEERKMTLISTKKV